ncbi:F-box only protein 25 isoform X1 [Sphaeramia orbicularis]|uniref:F-box only protein 25 isoform X1 n=1 Tax=Sphaeramia orbicularis TaxID=375764 RepID=UPI00117F8394|nr:F-box only protein 25 isoform X1 [Sphaeramia orbicularis]XP_029984396.1 F-box only protein 25 isoform X1 [Sphaeramia orbicularis]XP_029984397.1 F-box only protein 25 isoform X1 [Sphaeramia orbicularis]
MPFLGKDWRSPGWSWEKTDNGWKRIVFYGEELEDNDKELAFKELCSDNKENLFVGDVCELASTKRKKDFYNNNTKSQFVFRDKWIYVQKGSTKERHGYCTLGEALNRLDFSSAIQDLRRFNYVAKLFQLIARSQLTSLSGAAQKNYFNILEKIVRKVLEDHYNPRLVKDLLQDLISTLHNLTIHVGRIVLVGNINIWLCRLETILKWQQQLNNLQIPKQVRNGMLFSDLPLHTQNKILYKLSDACDIINLGQTTPTLQSLSENKTLWKKLCHFHFADKQFCRNLVLSNSENVDWKLMYFTLRKHYPMKEQYGDTLHFCKHCSILFWQDRHLALLFKDCGHPCTANDPDSCLMPISPQHFIDLFQF